MWNILDHYRQLSWRYRKLILWILVVAVVGTAVWSTIRLVVRPVYLASSSILMMPTDAELAFAGGGLGSSKTAHLLTDVQVEYLKSRSVAEGAMKLLEEAGVESLLRKAEEEKTGVSSLITAVMRGARSFRARVFVILNYGRYVKPDPSVQRVRFFRRAITVRKVTGSYILRIDVRLNSPKAAQRAANVLAEAYAARMNSERQAMAAQLEEFLSVRIAEREAELAVLTAREFQLTRELGITPGGGDTAAARVAEQKKFSEGAVKIRTLEQRIAELKAGRHRTTRKSVLATLDAEIALGEAELRAMEAGQQVRRQSLQRLDIAWQAQKGAEEPLIDLRADADALSRDVRELRNRLLSVSVSEATSLGRVRVIDEAVTPDYPVEPRVLDNTIMGLVAGLLLSVVLLVGIDTYSTKISTAADLDRYCGGRSLGGLDGSLVSAASGKRPLNSKQQARLRTVGSRLEMRLAMQGSFNAPRIQVTGLAPEADLLATTVALARALAEAGRDVVCMVPDGEVDVSVQDASSRLRFASALAEEPVGAVVVAAVPSVLRGFRHEVAAAISPALICAVQAGDVGPDQIGDFRERATAAGITALSFVLVDP